MSNGLLVEGLKNQVRGDGLEAVNMMWYLVKGAKERAEVRGKIDESREGARMMKELVRERDRVVGSYVASQKGKV